MDVFDESFQQRIVVTERFDISRRVGIGVAVAPALLFLAVVGTVFVGVRGEVPSEVIADWGVFSSLDQPTASAVADDTVAGRVVGGLSFNGAAWLAALAVSAVCFVLGISDRSRSSLWGALWAGSLIVMAAGYGVANTELQIFADAIDRSGG